MSIHDYPSIFSRLRGLTAAQRAEVFQLAEQQWCWHCGGPQGACECGWPAGTDAGSEDAVSRDPGVFGGAAVVAGSRVPVFMLHGWHQGGIPLSTLAEWYPHLSMDRIRDAIAYACDHRDEVQADREHYEAVAASLASPNPKEEP